MTEISPFRGSNFLTAVYSFFDFSLSGRIPPLYVPVQMFVSGLALALAEVVSFPRLALTFFLETRQLRALGPFDDLNKWVENRKYSDNPLIPYMNTYDVFAIPITFTPDYWEMSLSNGTAEIMSIRCIFLSCELESPIKGKDSDNQTAYKKINSRTGKAYNQKPKINNGDYYDEAKENWTPGKMLEPFIFGAGSPVPLSVLSVVGGDVVLPVNNAPSLGPEFTYIISGYVTERHFFDREWITEWGVRTNGTSLPYRIKTDVYGAYFQDPNTYSNAGNVGTDIPPDQLEDKHWIKFASWGIDDYYEDWIGDAERIDNPRIERYIRGATRIIQYKPSEIGSLRFYFYFYVETDVVSPLSINDHVCHFTVKYNQQIADKRLQWAQNEINPDQKRCPFLSEATVLQLTAEHYGFPNVEAYLGYKNAIGSNFGGGYLNNPRTNPNPNV